MALNRKAVTLMIAAGLSGVFVLTPHAAPQKDMWYRGVPKEIQHAGGWKPIDERNILEVRDSMQAHSAALLKDRPIVQIAYPIAEKLAGGTLPNIPNTQPYLVRSVYLYKESGGYFLSTLGNKLWVHHASLGRTRPTMSRRALIVQLSERPQEIYVTASMAE